MSSTTNKKYTTTPTIEENPVLSITEMAKILRNSLKRKGADERKIISVLTSCSNSQRHEIAKAYYLEFKRNLEKDLRRKLCGNFESLIVGLIYPPTDFFVRQLNKALKGMDTDANAIIEVLITRTNEEIKEITKSYEKAFDRPLVEHLRSKTSGDFKKLLTLIVTEPRAAETGISKHKTNRLFEEICSAAQEKTTIVDVLIKIFGRESYKQLHLLFEKYKTSTGQSIEEMLNLELSGNLLKLTLAIVKYIQSPVRYFARQLHRAIEGAKTDDHALIRIIVERSEIDLVDITKEYKKLFEKSLRSDIKEATSGNYKKALLELIGGH